MSELTHEILEENRAHRWRTTIVSVCASIIVTSLVSIGVTVYLTNEANDDFCRLQAESRIEGNKRVVYTRATKVIIQHFPPVEAWLRDNHPELYPLPDITILPPIDCKSLAE